MHTHTTDTTVFKSTVGNLHYQVLSVNDPDNSSPRFVCVAGLNQNMSFWKPIMEHHLTIPAHVLVFDNLCVGQSDSVSFFVSTTTTFASAILELLDHLEWTSNLSIIGHSLGGMISLRCVLMSIPTNPDRFSHVILCSTRGPFELPPVSTAFRSIRYRCKYPTLIVRQILRFGDHSDFWRSPCDWDPSMTNAEYYAQQSVLAKEGSSHSISSLLKQTVAAVVHHVNDNELNQLRESKAKFLVMTGEQDFYVKLQCSDILREKLNAEMVRMGGGHCFVQEKPRELLAKVQEFIVSEPM
ncbi:hypothetical protein GEMRC1_003580 [Eukaryota sp. GEM-RC1]